MLPPRVVRVVYWNDFHVSNVNEGVVMEEKHDTYARTDADDMKDTVLCYDDAVNTGNQFHDFGTCQQRAT